MNKIIVLSPGNTITGGPELLHQFVDKINSLGGDASILYFPFDQKFEVPEPYKHYDVKQIERSCVLDDYLIVTPEIYTGAFNEFNNGRRFIWWLSVDNYFESQGKGTKAFLKSFIGKRNYLKMDEMGEINHIVQSEYAKRFLENHGYSSIKVSDFLNKEHFAGINQNASRDDVVCYNPKKGVETTTRIIRNNPKIKFVPIQGMTSKEVSELLSKSKIYIDFGNHPGKDRIPREAAIAGCIVITGMQGSAANTIDIPVPDKYKVDEYGPYFDSNISEILYKSITEFEAHTQDFDQYRELIKNEECVFEKEVKKFIDSIE